MKYVYVLESMDSEHFYVGITDDLRAVSQAQRGRSSTYVKIRSLASRTYTAFDDDKRAFAFEKYLKSGSGQAFTKKRL